MFATLFLGTLGVLMGLFVLYQCALLVSAVRADRAARQPTADPAAIAALTAPVRL